MELRGLRGGVFSRYEGVGKRNLSKVIEILDGSIVAGGRSRVYCHGDRTRLLLSCMNIPLGYNGGFCGAKRPLALYGIASPLCEPRSRSGSTLKGEYSRCGHDEYGALLPAVVIFQVSMALLKI